MTNNRLSKKAFSLIEILVAVIIVGVIASIALSKYGMVVERARAKEGESILYQAYAEASRRAIENNLVNICGSLTLQTESPYFSRAGGGSWGTPPGQYGCVFTAVRVPEDSPGMTTYTATVNCAGQTDIGFVTGNNKYVLYIVGQNCTTATPQVKCASSSANPNICAQLGY